MPTSMSNMIGFSEVVSVKCQLSVGIECHTEFSESLWDRMSRSAEWMLPNSIQFMSEVLPIFASALGRFDSGRFSSNTDAVFKNAQQTNQWKTLEVCVPWSHCLDAWPCQQNKLSGKKYTALFAHSRDWKWWNIKGYHGIVVVQVSATTVHADWAITIHVLIHAHVWSPCSVYKLQDIGISWYIFGIYLCQ